MFGKTAPATTLTGNTSCHGKSSRFSDQCYLYIQFFFTDHCTCEIAAGCCWVSHHGTVWCKMVFFITQLDSLVYWITLVIISFTCERSTKNNVLITWRKAQLKLEKWVTGVIRYFVSMKFSTLQSDSRARLCYRGTLKELWVCGLQVRLRCQKGIPPALRGRTWLYLSGGKVKREQNQGKFQVSQAPLSVLLFTFLIPWASGYPSAFTCPVFTPLDSWLRTLRYSAQHQIESLKWYERFQSADCPFVCSVRSWIISPGIPNGWMSLRKTCIGSFPFTKCSCHGEDTGRRRPGISSAAFWMLTIVCGGFLLPQAAGPVPGSKGLHPVQTGGGILPGSGPHRRCVTHAHACRGAAEGGRGHICAHFYTRLINEFIIQSFFFLFFFAFLL